MRSPPPLLFSKYIPSTLIDTVHHPVWGLSSRPSRGLASFDGRAFVQELLRCSFLHAILELQSETRHPQSPLATILPRSGRSPRSDPKFDRPLTDHGANAADHRAGARPKKWVIGAIKGAIGRQMIGKEAQISGKTTLSKR